MSDKPLTQAEIMKDAWVLLEWLPKQLKGLDSNVCAKYLSEQLWTALYNMSENLKRLQRKTFTIGQFYKGQEGKDTGKFFIARFEGFSPDTDRDINGIFTVLVSSMERINYSDSKDRVDLNTYGLDNMVPIKVASTDLPQYTDCFFKGKLYEEMLNQSS